MVLFLFSAISESSIFSIFIFTLQLRKLPIVALTFLNRPREDCMKCCLCTTNPALFLWLSPCSDMTLHENLHFIKVHSHGVAYSFTLRHSPNSTALFSQPNISSNARRTIFRTWKLSFWVPRHLKKQRSWDRWLFEVAAPLCAVGGREWLLSFVLNGGFIRARMANRLSKHFLFPQRERKRR